MKNTLRSFQRVPTMVVLVLTIFCCAELARAIVTSAEWHAVHHDQHSPGRRTSHTPEHAMIQVDEVGKAGRVKGSYKYVSALNKPDGPRGHHAEDLWREGSWLSFEPLHANRVRVTVSSRHSVRANDVLHLDMFTAAHMRRVEEPTSVPSRHYRVISVTPASEDGLIVEYGVRPCGLDELFQDLQLDLQIEFPKNKPRFVEGNVMAPVQPLPIPRDHGDSSQLQAEKISLGTIGKMAHKAFKRMKNVASKVKTAINFAGTLFEGIVTGDLDLTHTEDWTVVNYHYDTTAQAASCTLNLDDVFGSSVSGTCENCYAYAGLTVNFLLNIQSYQVQAASVAASGGIDISLKSTLSVTGEYAQEYLVTTYHNHFTFDIDGIPIDVEIDTPITLSVDATAAGQLPVDILFRALVDAGLSYDPDAPNNLKLTNQATFEAGGNVPALSALSFSEGSLNLGLRADAWIKVYNMGGPVISLSATPELGMEASESCSIGLVSSNVGVEGTLAGKLVFPALDVDLETEPVAILNTKHNIYTGCGGSSTTGLNMRRLIENSTLPPVGTVYDGSASSSCTGELIIQAFSAQVTYTVTIIQMELIFNSYGATASEASDVWGGYIIDIYTYLGDSLMKPCVDDFGNHCGYDYGNYSATTGTNLFSDPFLCQFNYPTGSISCQSLGGCTNVTMKVNPLSNTVSGASIEEVRAQTTPTICPYPEDDDGGNNGGNDDGADDDGASATTASVWPLLLTLVLTGILANVLTF